MAQREIMCAYGDCHETMVAGKDFKITVSESNRGTVWDRQSYCCLEHAWRALKHQDEQLNGKREKVASGG